MDLSKKKIRIPAEEPPSSTSEYHPSNLETSSKSVENTPEDLFRVPNLPSVRRHSGGFKTPSRPLTDASGEIWPNKEMWQYMTLPFTITLALQNLSPYGKNSTRNLELTSDATKQQKFPFDANYMANTLNSNSLASTSIQQILNPSRSVPDVTPPTLPLKGKFRRSKVDGNLFNNLNDLDIAALLLQSKNMMNATNADAFLGRSVFDNPDLLQTFYNSTSDFFKGNGYSKYAVPNKPKKTQKLPCRDVKVDGGRKRKAQDISASINEASEPRNSGNQAQIFPPDIEIALTSNSENTNQGNNTSCMKYAHKSDTTVTETNELMPRNLKTTKRSTGAKQIKKVRFSVDVKKEKPPISKKMEADAVLNLPRIVFPIYKAKASKKVSSLKNPPRYYVSKETTSSEQEIWTIREKIELNENEGIAAQNVTTVIDNPFVPKDAETKPPISNMDNVNQANVADHWLEDIAQDIKKELTRFKNVPQVEAPVPDSEASASSDFPTRYQNELLQRLSKERIRKAYNLHETLLEKLGGTSAMPERKLEIDLFRRDLILELIRKQFEVENVDELRDSIMKYLGDQQKAKSYVEIIENVTKEKKE